MSRCYKIKTNGWVYLRGINNLRRVHVPINSETREKFLRENEKSAVKEPTFGSSIIRLAVCAINLICLLLPEEPPFIWPDKSAALKPDRFSPWVRPLRWVPRKYSVHLTQMRVFTLTVMQGWGWKQYLAGALASVLTALWTCDQLSCRDQLLDCGYLLSVKIWVALKYYNV